MKFIRCFALVALVVLASTPLVAESIVGANKFICAIIVQEVCASDEPCTDGGPTSDTKIPEFLQFDMKQRTVGTTQAGGLTCICRPLGGCPLRLYKTGTTQPLRTLGCAKRPQLQRTIDLVRGKGSGKGGLV